MAKQTEPAQASRAARQGAEAAPAGDQPLRHVLENSRDILYKLDMHTGRYEYISPAAARLLGYSPEEFGSKMYEDLKAFMHPEDWARFADRLERFAPLTPADEHCFTVEYRLRHRDGHWLWFQDNHTVLPDGDGQVRYVVGAARDITADREMAELTRRNERKLDQAIEQERQRLAGELHDSIGQQLVAIKVLLQKALAEQPPVDPAPAEQLMRCCAEAIGEVRRICHGLYPPTLEQLGLVAALRQLTAGNGSDSPRLSLAYDEALDRRRFGEHVEISLFRICQEAIANALHHGQAGQVRVELTSEGDRLVLVVADDGRGFEPATATMGLGLHRMRRRAASCGGELLIYSEPGRCVVRTAVPMDGP